MWIIIGTEVKCCSFSLVSGISSDLLTTPREWQSFYVTALFARCRLISRLDKDETVATTVYVFITCPWSECAAVRSWKDLLRLKLNSQPRLQMDELPQIWSLRSTDRTKSDNVCASTPTAWVTVHVHVNVFEHSHLCNAALGCKQNCPQTLFFSPPSCFYFKTN